MEMASFLQIDCAGWAWVTLGYCRMCDLMFSKSDCFLLIALYSVCDSERFGSLTISLGFYFMMYWFNFYMYMLMFEHWLLQGILFAYLTDWEHTADSSQCGFRSHWMWDIREGRISEPGRIGERSCRSLYHQGAKQLRCWSFLTSKSVCNSTSQPWWTLTEQAMFRVQNHVFQ